MAVWSGVHRKYMYGITVQMGEQRCSIHGELLKAYRKRLELRVLCFLPWPACLFTPMLKGIKLSDEDRSSSG
jgi:hypothetical protein